MPENVTPPPDDRVREAVDRNKTRAEEYLHDPDKSQQLLEEALKKANRNQASHQFQTDFWSELKAFFRLLQAYIRREYTVVPWASIVMVTAAIIYFVSPIDLILDWIPLAGFIDDAAVLVFVLRQVKIDLAKFQEWEQTRDPSQQIIDL